MMTPSGGNIDMPFTREEIARKMKELATPIDFADLALRRILIKKGA